MRTTFFKTCGASIAALGLGLSFAATPLAADAAAWHGGGGHAGHVGGGWRGGGMAHGGGWRGGGWRGGGGWHGGYGGGGYYDGDGLAYGAAALGLGLLGGAIVGSQYPYYDYGADYSAYPQTGSGNAAAYCESRFKSYNPATGTYLGYDGLHHPCP